MLIFTKNLCLKYHAEITEKLKGIGFQKVIPVTPGLDRELRGKYIRKSFKSSGRAFIVLPEIIKADSDDPGKTEAFEGRGRGT